MVINYCENIFQYEKFPVEYICYQQLKEIDNINYVAIPWTQILNSHWLNFPGRRNQFEYLNVLRNYKMSQRDNFTVCQHDSYLSLSDIYKSLNITTIFSVAYDKNDKIDGIKIIPMPFNNGFIFEERSKDILFSFIGSYETHPIREQMRRTIFGDNIVYRNSYHVGSDISDTKKKEELEYKDVLERSKFSLCPRGSNPSSVRFYESLGAGAVPVLISDNWVLPEWDWDNTIIKIEESKFAKYSYQDLEKILGDIDSVRYSELQNNCKLAYDKYKYERFGEYILENI